VAGILDREHYEGNVLDLVDEVQRRVEALEQTELSGVAGPPGPKGDTGDTGPPGPGSPSPLTQGDVLVVDGVPGITTLGIGSAHEILKVNAGGTDPGWEAFDWDEMSGVAGADMAHDHSAAAEGGALLDLNGAADALVLDADGDTTVSAPADDQIDIQVSGADDFRFLANEFSVLSGSHILIADNAWIGLGAAAGRIEFDDLATDEINFLSCDVGIGTTNPQYTLDVTDTGVPQRLTRTSALTASGAACFLLRHTTSGNMADGFGSNTNYIIRDVAGVDNTITVISNIRDGADDSGMMQFFTNNAGSLAARVTIKSDGKVGIGTAAPGGLMEWNFATEDLEFIDAGSAAATEQDWIEVQVGNVTGYIRVFAAK
jgi:hypothetical protein